MCYRVVGVCREAASLLERVVLDTMKAEQTSDLTDGLFQSFLLDFLTKEETKYPVNPASVMVFEDHQEDMHDRQVYRLFLVGPLQMGSALCQVGGIESFA